MQFGIDNLEILELRAEIHNLDLCLFLCL